MTARVAQFFRSVIFLISFNKNSNVRSGNGMGSQMDSLIATGLTLRFVFHILHLSFPCLGTTFTSQYPDRFGLVHFYCSEVWYSIKALCRLLRFYSDFFLWGGEGGGIHTEPPTPPSPLPPPPPLYHHHHSTAFAGAASQNTHKKSYAKG